MGSFVMTVTDPPPPALPSWAYFLDVDGTLLEIAERPELVRVAPGLLKLLADLRTACGGALALVSGRTLAEIDRLFAPLRLPAAGTHGGERRRGDGELIVAAGGSLDLVRGPLRAFARLHRLRLEDKNLALALHYRDAPELAPAVLAFARELAAGTGGALRLIEGKMVAEFKARGFDKGKAIAAFMAEPPFAGRCPVFAGDDTTDEDGFRAVAALGGLAIRVGERRPTAARWHLPSVAALHEWLRDACPAAPPWNADPLRSVEDVPSATVPGDP